MSLSNIRDLIIIVGIYLYFMSWIYLHYYYQTFGVSPGSLHIDYSSYVLFSYIVISSAAFLRFLFLVILGLFLFAIVFRYIHHPACKTFQQWIYQCRWYIIFSAMVLLFPILFSVAAKVAAEQAMEDRSDLRGRPIIQFIFRKNAEGFNAYPPADNSPDILTAERKADLTLLRSDSVQSFRLLGESDAYYLILRQAPLNKTLGVLPNGAVYFVNKNDVLLTKIILSSK
jgi:hypothetical protein